MMQVYCGYSSEYHALRQTDYVQETSMTQKAKDQPRRPGQPHPSPEAEKELNKQKQKSAENEVAGRHKNDGQNDHAGHKTAR
jgi:hypothetical protein